MESDSMDWHVAVPRYDGTELRFWWTGDYSLKLRVLRSEVVIEGNAAGLETLARHLLTLAQPGVESGSHLHLEPGMGLEEGSLVVEREDGPSEQAPAAVTGQAKGSWH